MAPTTANLIRNIVSRDANQEKVELVTLIFQAKIVYETRMNYFKEKRAGFTRKLNLAVK